MLVIRWVSGEPKHSSEMTPEERRQVGTRQDKFAEDCAEETEQDTAEDEG